MPRRKRTPEIAFIVCTGDACQKRGARGIKQALEEFCPLHGRRVREQECLGLCRLAPLLLENGHMIPSADAETIRRHLSVSDSLASQPPR